MKKVSFCIIAVIVATGVIAVLWPWFTPSAESFAPVIASNTDGTAYLAENRGEVSFIYRVDADAKITAAYKIKNELSANSQKGISEVTAAAVHGGRLYCIRETRSEENPRSDCWTLIELASELTSARAVYTGSYKSLPRITGLSSAGDALYVTGITAEGSEASVLEWTGALPAKSAFKEPERGLSVSAPENDPIQSAVAGDGVIYAVLRSGKIAQLRRTETVYTPEAITGCALSVNAGQLCFAEDSQNRVFFETDDDFNKLDLTKGMSVRASAALPSGALLLASLPEAEGAALLRIENGTKQELTLSCALKAQLCLTDWPPALFIILVLILAALLVISAFFLLMSKTFANRATAGFAAVTLLILAIIGSAQAQNAGLDYENARLDEARRQSGYISTLLGEYDYTAFAENDFIASAEYTALAKHFALSRDTDDAAEIRTELLYITDDAEVVAVSRRFAYKLSAGGAYGSEALKAIRLAVKNNGTVSVMDGSSAVSVRPCLYGGQIAALIVTQVAANDLESDLMSMLSKLLSAGLIIASAATLLVYLMNRRLMRPVRNIIRGMGQFSDGNFETDGTVSTQGDFGKVQRAMTEMGVSLAIREYETNMMINSFYRFVPRGIEKLLNRAGVMEISSGDVTTVKDSLCIVSVENRDAAQSRGDDHDFMTFVNLCFSIVHSCVQKHNGMLLSGDFNLAALPVLFSDEAGESAGVDFGLDLTGSLKNDTYNETLTPDFFLLLHNIEFLYGIAGTEDKAFPFISSSEMNFLSAYSRPLRSLGTRIVVTEQYFKSLTPQSGDSPPYSSRFIGFISSEDERYSYKLYEILDCYPDSERNLRERYDNKLQEALTLYYKDNFYLARGIFSAILRTNPEDGVARWYAFACEHFFNSSDQAEINYNLFGIKE